MLSKRSAVTKTVLNITPFLNKITKLLLYDIAYIQNTFLMKPSAWSFSRVTKCHNPRATFTSVTGFQSFSMKFLFFLEHHLLNACSIYFYRLGELKRNKYAHQMATPYNGQILFSLVERTQTYGFLFVYLIHSNKPPTSFWNRKSYGNCCILAAQLFFLL